jgi:hypothetical protein
VALAPILSIHCPYCTALNENIPLVGRGQDEDHSCGWTDSPLISGDEDHSDMRGWHCQGCARVFNRDNLAAKKWKDDVAKFLGTGIKLQ